MNRIKNQSKKPSLKNPNVKLIITKGKIQYPVIDKVVANELSPFNTRWRKKTIELLTVYYRQK